MLNIVSWNCEDFFVFTQKKNYDINTLHKLQYSPIIGKLQEAHIILLQEWNNNNGNFINNYLPNYEILIVDRTAVLYKKGFFGEDVKSIEIPLLYEAPTSIEKMYTSGRQKSNIFVKLYYGEMPIYVGCFHLSAYSPYQHPGFHKKQLNDYINKCISTALFKENNQSNLNGIENNYALIIGGDTNFNDGKPHNNLFEDLINSDLRIRLQLSDVCQNKCNTIMTQYPQCMHEKDLGKMIARNVTKLKDYSSRLDLLLVNKTLTPTSTNIINDCNLSDHSLITSSTVLNIQSTGGTKNIKRRKISKRRKKTNVKSKKRRRSNHRK